MYFKKETPILYFAPRPSTRWSKRYYLLWPAWSYRVVAPRVRHRKLNILEKAVLGMCHAGAFSATEIGEQLDIGRDLAALVIKQLSKQGFINHKGLLTKRGSNILEQETVATQDMIAGFIFQDPWTGELWPRFVQRQEYAEVSFNNEGFPDLIFGTTGKPDNRRAYMPLPVKNSTKIQPTPLEILVAVKKHKKALQNPSSSEDLEESEEAWSFEQLPTLKRISFVEEEPTPVWLATFIYLPENSLSTTTWNVCDPFGLGDSPWLRRRIEIQKNKNTTVQGMQKIILEMIGARRDENGDFPIFIDRIHDEAVMSVEDKLTLGIRRYDNLLNALVAMERTYIEAEALANSKSLQDKLDDVLVKAQKAIESLLISLREKYPTNDSWKVLSPRDQEYNRNLLDGLAARLGFTTPLPNSLVGVKQGKVKSSADYGEGSLRSHLLAALLTARHNSNHPLQAVAQKVPDMLVRLDELAGLRDKSSHSSNQHLEIAEVARQISTVYEFIASMLGLTLYSNPTYSSSK